jgi:hypothetical protein
MSGTHVDEEITALLPHFKNLVRLAPCWWHTSSFTFTRLPRLQQLRLHNVEQAAMEQLGIALAECKQLNMLDSWDPAATDEQVLQLLLSVPQLTELRLGPCMV